MLGGRSIPSPARLTFIDLHIRQCLPLVHGDYPAMPLSPTAKVDDQP